MFDIDYIIPCYGKSEIIRPGLRALANQWKSEFIHVILVNDCSPNTKCDYADLVEEFKKTGDCGTFYNKLMPISECNELLGISDWNPPGMF